jgi:multiple antibiotic resistance protein
MQSMSFYSAVVILLMVMDPFGNIPAFLSILSNLTPGRRRRVIFRELLIALVVLAGFLFFGQHMLNGLHISEAALTISGGILLFMISIKMIFPVIHSEEFNMAIEEPLVVPLAIPLIAGPSAMAIVILFTARYPDQKFHWLGALIVAWSVTGCILLFADTLARKLGSRTLKAMERLMGMILTVMAVQMLLNGIRLYIQLNFNS